MISWKAQLSPKKIQEVASFVLSIQGSKPANGKEPQGDKWVDDSAPKDSTTAAPAADSAATALTK
jgi:cytochrome c oxidase cbb3-type subunit 3